MVHVWLVYSMVVLGLVTGLEEACNALSFLWAREDALQLGITETKGCWCDEYDSQEWALVGMDVWLHHHGILMHSVAGSVLDMMQWGARHHEVDGRYNGLGGVSTVVCLNMEGLVVKITIQQLC